MVLQKYKINVILNLYLFGSDCIFYYYYLTNNYLFISQFVNVDKLILVT